MMRACVIALGCLMIACSTPSRVASTVATRPPPTPAAEVPAPITDDLCKKDLPPSECWCSATKLPPTERRANITGPLSDLSERFREAHAAARKAECMQLSTKGVLIRYSVGTVEVSLNGRPIAVPTSIYTPYVHILKSVTHAVFLASLLYDEPAGPARDQHVAAALGDLQAVRAVFQEGAPPVQTLVPAAERSRQILILSLTHDFLASLQKNQQTAESREAYLLRVRPLVLADIKDAARAALMKLHETLATARIKAEQESPGAWRSLTVVANVGHQARARELAVQYFERLLGEAAGEGARNERRLVIVENAFKPSDQRGALSAHRVDRRSAEVIFKDPFRLQWDVLADSGGLLDELLPLGGASRN